MKVSNILFFNLPFKSMLLLEFFYLLLFLTALGYLRMIFVFLLLFTILLLVVVCVVLSAFFKTILQNYQNKMMLMTSSWRYNWGIGDFILYFWISYFTFWFIFWDFNISMGAVWVYIRGLIILSFTISCFCKLIMFSCKVFVFLFSMYLLLVRWNVL